MYHQITSWPNMLLAYRKASKYKRRKSSTAAFEHQLADHLLDLQADLVNQTYQPGDYVHFMIHDPKKRKISAAPFRDRVVHHALCNIIEPLFEAQFIQHSYANRVNKGTHQAVDTLQMFCQQFSYVLRMDIKKHFPSIDHVILFDILANTITDEATNWLVHQVIRSGVNILYEEYEMVYFQGDDLFAINRPRGLPIGNLTSQFWSNCYLNPMDWFITQDLACQAYLRYVDDFALFSNCKKQLYKWKREIINFLTSLRLVIHESQAQVIPCKVGIPWLGFVIYPTRRRLKARNVVKFTRRFEQSIMLYENNRISFAELDATVQGWINHVCYADSWGIRKHIFEKHPIIYSNNNHMKSN